MNTTFSTAKAGKVWVVRKEGTSGISSKHSNRSDAWAETRRLARGSDGNAVLKDTNGSIRARNAYGKEPFRSKG
jgi:uncharacterized protein DUF2188